MPKTQITPASILKNTNTDNSQSGVEASANSNKDLDTETQLNTLANSQTSHHKNSSKQEKNNGNNQSVFGHLATKDQKFTGQIVAYNNPNDENKHTSKVTPTGNYSSNISNRQKGCTIF